MASPSFHSPPRPARRSPALRLLPPSFAPDLPRHLTAQRLRAAVWPVALLGQFVLGLGLSWRTWPDVLVDFGRERFVPAALLHGKSLYGDLAYFNGPLSPWVNAGWFALLGESLSTLIFANSLVLVLFAWSLSRLLCRVVSPFAACLGASAMLWLCGFFPYLEISNYNWICPYSHEMTHGLLASVGALIAADHYAHARQPGWLVLSAICLGLVLLTKAEIGVATAFSWALMIGPAIRIQAEGARTRDAALAAFGVLAPAGISLAVLTRSLPGPVALRGILGSWAHIGRSDLTHNPYYRAVMGTDNLFESLLSTAQWAAITILILGVGYKLSRSSKSFRTARRNSILLMAGLLLLLWLLRDAMDWLSLPRPWPWILVGLAAGQAWRWRHATVERQASERSALAIICWSGLLLLKIAFFCRIFHYGFGLAAPALALLVGWGWDRWPRWAAAPNGYPAPARASAMSVLALAILTHGALAANYLSRTTVSIGGGPDQFWTDGRGHEINSLLECLEQTTRCDESLLCLPEGALVNVLADRSISTRYLNFVPGDVLIFGEQQMLDDLKTHPPDWIAMIHRDTSEYGPARFGQDYAESLGAWIGSEYEPTAGSRVWPHAEGSWLLMKRRADSTNPSGREPLRESQH